MLGQTTTDVGTERKSLKYNNSKKPKLYKRRIIFTNHLSPGHTTFLLCNILQYIIFDRTLGPQSKKDVESSLDQG